MNLSRRGFIGSALATAGAPAVLAATAAAKPLSAYKRGALGKIVGELPPGRYDSHIHVFHRDEPEPERFRREIEGAGLAGCCLFSLRPDRRFDNEPPEPDPEWAMDNVIRWCSASPTFYPFYWIDPVRPDACDLVDLAVKKGIYGFKVIRNQGKPCEGAAMKTYARIAEHKKPLTFHTGILWDGKASSDNFRPANWEPLLEIPHLRFALCHISWPWCDECIAVYGKLLNAIASRGDKVPEMFIDTTPGTPKIYRRDALAKVFTIGYDVMDHVQFGTDCNVKKYNADWCVDWQRTDDAIFAELGLDAKTVDSNYRGSLQRYLFGGDNKPRKVPVPDGTLGKRKGNDIT